MPRNIVMDRTAIMIIVPAAFFDSGGLNAGTPFDTASTPVIAVQPLEKAVSSRKSVSGSFIALTGSTGTTGDADPASTRHVPTATSESIVKTKKYVGAAKMRP